MNATDLMGISLFPAQALAQTLAVRNLVGFVDLGTLIGVPANLMVLVSSQPAPQSHLQFQFMIMTSAKEQRPA